LTLPFHAEQGAHFKARMPWWDWLRRRRAGAGERQTPRKAWPGVPRSWGSSVQCAFPCGWLSKSVI